MDSEHHEEENKKMSIETKLIIYNEKSTYSNEKILKFNLGMQLQKSIITKFAYNIFSLILIFLGY